MKKVILMLVALIAISLGAAQAQKLTKEEKAAQKAKQEAEMVSLMDRLFATTNFQFIPTEVQSKTGGTLPIQKFESAKLRPDSFIVDMHKYSDGGNDYLSINTNRYEVIKNEKVKDARVLTFKVEANGATYTFDIAANAKTGYATMKVKSNRSEDNIYKGSIREH